MFSFKPSVDINHPAYGQVFDVDFSESFIRYNISKDLLQGLETSQTGDYELNQGSLRQVIQASYIYALTKFIRNEINAKKLAEMISYDDKTLSSFYISYPYDKQKFSTLEDFFNVSVKFVSQAVQDFKGFGLTPHYDNRFVLGNVIINLENNIDSTKFYLDGEVYHIGPKEFGKGVFFLNHHNTLHSISVENQDIRTSLITGIHLKI